MGRQDGSGVDGVLVPMSLFCGRVLTLWVVRRLAIPSVMTRDALLVDSIAAKSLVSLLQLPAEERGSPLGVALVALSGALPLGLPCTCKRSVVA